MSGGDHCPVCGSDTEFVPFGLAARPRAMWPWVAPKARSKETDSRGCRVAAPSVPPLRPASPESWEGSVGGKLDAQRAVFGEVYPGDARTLREPEAHVAPEEPVARRLTAVPSVDYLSIDLESPQAMRRMDLTQLLSRENR